MTQFPPKEYVNNFKFSIKLKLGRTYSSQFQEFHSWAHDNLGIKYKDWCLLSYSKEHYTLLIRDSKWGTFLALKFADLIDT